ncbi:MAG: nickel pincer cofactor biosynthesis protein LarB [bacterium]
MSTINSNLAGLLDLVANGQLSPDEARRQIEGAGERHVGYARIDTDRLRRCGLPEAIFSPGKTVEQIVGILHTMRGAGQNGMATRVSQEQATAIGKAIPEVVYHHDARIITLDTVPLPPPTGLVAVVCAGTSDIPVAAEAALTAERMGAHVEPLYDVGVAGLHRLLRHVDALRAARVVVVVAGMEGALPSVVGGLLDRPLIAVPTSIGYGAGQGGFAALLAMLNSCVPGITVVNIDNGFGAGVAAALINRNQ